MGRVPIPFAIGVLVGAIAATGVCFLTLKWPITCSVDGTLFWGAVGALGAIATGVGAVYASRRATEIAGRQADYVVDKGKNRTRIIAALVRGELLTARQQIFILGLINGSFKGSNEDFIKLMGPTVISDPKLALKYALDLDAHGDGDLVAQAIAHVRELSQTVEGIKLMGGMRELDEFDRTVETARQLLRKAVEKADSKVVGAINVLPGDDD